MINKKRVILVGLFVLLFFFTRLSNLNQFPPFEDNFSWLYRINYYPWIITANLKGQYIEGKDLSYAGTISYHPGVTIMTFSGISNKIAKKFKFAVDKNYVECGYLDYSCPYLDYELFWSKFPLVIISGLLFGYTLLLFLKIAGSIAPIIWALIILFEPTSVYLSKDLHLDFIFLMFTISAFLSLVVSIFEKNSRYLYTSGVLFGFALLTRFIGIIFFPFILYTFLVNYKFNYAILRAFKFFVITAVTFILVYPPMWVAPMQTVSFMINSSRGLTDDLAGLVPFHIRYINGLVYYYNQIMGSFSLMFIFVLLNGLILFFIFGSNYIKRFLLPIFYLFIWYLLVINISDKRYLRYLLPSFFGISMLSSYGFAILLRSHAVKRFLSRFFPRIFSG